LDIQLGSLALLVLLAQGLLPAQALVPAHHGWTKLWKL
jgi:hypothetical protein